VNPPTTQSEAKPPRYARALVACSIAALVWAVAARVAGPSDLWDQRQPRTVSYTTDILVNGGSHWILPMEPGRRPATKPPLYNWMAAPAVKLLGFPSELGHKLPSVVALGLCWLVLVRAGRRLDAAEGEALGWLAGLMLVANYTFFKLGYLARPDMLLTLWLMLGWLASTWLLVDWRRGPAPAGGGGRLSPAAQRGLALGFWVCVGLAGLTKGPAALPLVVYAFIAARLVGGRWAALGALRWWWGLPLGLLMAGSWVCAAWWIDPVHVRQELWSNEIVGRLTGLGPEGSREGPIGLLKSAPNMPVYYLARFAPWSLLSILAAGSLWRRVEAGGRRRWRTLGTLGAVLHGAAIFVIVVLALYTLSASKRADYIAAAFGPGALLAAWWVVHGGLRLQARLPWVVPVFAAALLGLMTALNWFQWGTPTLEFSRTIGGFITDCDRMIRAEPHPVAFWRSGVTHVQALLGSTDPDIHERERQWARELDGPAWVVAGRRTGPPYTFAELAAEQSLPVRVERRRRSVPLPWHNIWHERFSLYLVTPVVDEAGSP